MKRLAALAAAAALTLAGCADDLDHGVVTGKEHHDGYSTTTIMYCGKGCFMPLTTYVPESWVLHLRDGEHTGDHDVTAEEYDRYREGDVYPRPDEGDR